MEKALSLHFKHVSPLKEERVQSLWSGYGAVLRYSPFEGNSNSSDISCIAKVIDLNQQGHHPRGWDTDISHKRKLSSYINEQNFYRYFAPFTTKKCQTPKMYDAGEEKDCIWMLMEDLNSLGFVKRSEHPTLSIVQMGIAWLANFHACFFDSAIVDQKNTSSKTKLWPIGTYWHLSTRAHEWEAMPDSALKHAANKIDERLNKANFQTLVHGDAKLANFCIHQNETSLAAVDFQYVGFGAGIKDIVYFLGSCLDSDELYQHADSLLIKYFNILKSATAMSSLDYELLEKEYRSLYSFAWADFERFLCGWSPGHKKLNKYSAEQTKKALEVL